MTKEKNVPSNFAIPRPVSDGSCSQGKGASFLMPLESQTCGQRVTSLEKSCSTTLNGASWLNLYYYRGASLNSFMAYV
jgi:hypothetical protein